MQDVEIVFDPLPGDTLTRFVTESLAAYNVAATGDSSWYPVGFFLKSARGEWLGGLLAEIWSGWLQDSLGGRAGARPFYEKCGHEVFGTLEDYPPGHAKFFMRRRLAAAPT
jgi:hypothetical protein